MVRDTKVIIGIAAVGVLVLLSATCSAETTTTLRIRELQQEYTQTAQQVRAGRQHLLRLEGAIGILQQMENEDDGTTTSAEAGQSVSP